MDSMDISLLCIVCLVSGVLFTLIILGLQQDSADIINTKLLGEKMCAEKGLVYDHREVMPDSTPKIYCIKETPIEDGYLVLGE